MRPAVADIESPNPNNGPSFAGAVAEDYGATICGLMFSWSVNYHPAKDNLGSFSLVAVAPALTVQLSVNA